MPADFIANKLSRFRIRLEALINSESMENGSDTPDFMLAEYLTDCLVAFDKVVKLRDKWYEPEHDRQSEDSGPTPQPRSA
jgi:hypothetical protein